MNADIVKENDSEILTKVLSGSLSNSEIYQLLYSAVVDKHYSFLQCLLKHSRLDFYEPFEADGFRLPILHHAVRLGDFNAFKLLLEYGLNPLVCTGICQQNDTEFICEDIIQFAFRFTSNPNNQKSILLLFQTFLHKLITNLVEACRRGDDKSIEQLLTSSSSGSLRIHCTVKRFASRQFHLVVNSSNSSHDSSTDHVNDSTKPIHQPLTSLISNRLKSFKFNRRLSWITGSNRDNEKMEKKEKQEGQQQQDRPQTMLESLSLKEILRWSSDGISESYNLQSMNNDLWEWARSQVKSLLVICVQNNYIRCLNKLLQVGFEVIPVNSSLSSTFSATEESVELLNHNQEINHDSKFNDGLRILVEDISSIGKQQLWIESVCSNQESAIHTAVRLNREEAVKSIIQWEPYSLAVTCHSNNDLSIGILPIHIACALNRLNCLQLILTMNTSTLYLNNDHYNIENIESKLDSNHCNLFSCRINKSPGLYKHYYCIDQLDSYNMTGFLLAVIHGHVDIVRQLLKYTVKAKKLMNSTTTELNNFNIDINLDHFYQHHSTVPDNNTSTINTTDKFTCSNQLNVLGNQHSSLTDTYIDHTVYYDVCPIDIYRKISACWYFFTSIDNNNSTSLNYNRRSSIIINPRCHQSLDDHAICGYFNALQLSVMTGNIDTVSILVDYLSQEVNTFCTSCMHGQCYIPQDNSTLSTLSLSNPTCYSSHLTDEIVSSNLNSTNLQSIITTPLGLTCCLAETDENKAIEIASILLNIGAVDLNNQLFVYMMKKSFYKFAGLLFIHEILLKSTEINKPIEKDSTVIIRHLNLSNMKSLQSSIISNSFWYLNSIIPQWIKLLEDLSKFNYVSSLKSSSSSMSTSVKQESTMNENNDNRELYKYISQLFLSLLRPTFTMNFFNNISNQLITRITMSNCGLKTLPWCLFNCVKNLKELDLSKNHIRNLPTQLPNVPMAYRSCQFVSTCWTSSLIYLDLSENYLDYLPSWLFVNMYEYEQGIISSSCKGKLNNNVIDSHPLRRCYSETSINTTTSSLYHTTVMNDSFAPNLLHLLLSKNQLRVLPSEIWTGSLWCKLESLDLSWNKITYLPMPNLLKVQFEHSRQMYKQSLYMKTQCLKATDKINYCTLFPNSTEGVTFNFNSESVSYLPTDQLITTITNHYQPVENYITSNINNYNDNLFERKLVDCLYQYEQHTSHLTHLWLHHNCLKTLQLTHSISSINNYSTRIHSSKLLHQISLAQICPNLLYLDASYNSIENFFDLFLCPESIIYIDLSYNHMKIPDEHHHHHDYDSQSSSPLAYCQFETFSKSFSMNRCLSEKNRSNSTSYSLRNWNLNTFSMYNYYSKLEHLNLRGNQFHIFPYCCYTNTLIDKLNQTKRFNEFQLIKSLSFGIQSSYEVNLASSYLMSTEKEILLLFSKLKSLDLGENPYLKCICPSLLHSMNLQYLSLDCCITLCELPGDLFRLPNLQSILLNKTPFIKHLATLIDPTLKVNQVVGIQGNNNNDNDINDYPNLNEKIYTRRILSCLKSVTDQSYPYTRFRVMVVGPSGVGKTTLVRLLQASKTEKSSYQTNFNGNPFETDVHTSSSSSLRSNETDNIPDHLLPSVQITNLTISRHNNSKPNESINANVSSGITNNNTDTNRNFCEALSFSIWDLEKSVNTTISSVNTTANNNDNFESSMSDMSSELVFPSEVIINTQLGIHCQLTIYLVLWNTVDGVLGLNRITPWLMKIKSINPNCPIILIGTYLSNISSINKKTKNIKSHFNLMKNIIHNRFYKNSDLNAYGLPYIYNYMFINLSNINDNKYERIQKKISKLITLLYNAAYHFNITNRTADIMLPNISIIPSLSQSFLQLSIPKLYHLADSITQQLTIEIFNNQLIPIIEVNRFIFELNKCLSNLLPHPIRVCFSSNNNNNNGSAPVDLLSTSSLSSSSSPSSASSSSLYVTSCIHGFYTYADIKSILLFLNHIGTILYFSHHKLLKNYVFLSPQWLLNTLLKLMMNIHNKQLSDMFKNCHTLKRTKWMNTDNVQRRNCDDFMRSSSDISQLQDQVNDDDDKDSNHSKHIPNIVDNNNSFYWKRNSALIDSSYLTDLIKYSMRTRKIVNDNTSHIHMNNLHDIPLEEIFLGLFKQFGLMVSIITNDDLKCQHSDSSKMRKHKNQLLLLPSLLAARCFQPGRLHSYLQPAVIRYEENYPSVKQGSYLRSQSLGVSTYRPRYTVHRMQSKLRPVNNVNTVESCNNTNKNNNEETNHPRLSRFLSWHVQTSVSKEIVRLYAVTYVPFGFWTELYTRLLNDISLNEICGRIYNLSKLPSELFQQLLCNNDNFKNGFQYNCSSGSCNEHGHVDNCHTFMNTSSQCSLKPEWTVWKRGMRLSLGHGQIGLARLQQLTRANCALLRSQSFKQSFLNLANNRQSPSLRAFVSSCSPRSSSFSSTRNTNELISKLLPQSYYHEEWDEPCAIVGEEVMKQNKKSIIMNQNISNREKDFISFNLQLNNDFVYRSGVVETIKHSYEGRCLRLMHWVVQDDQKKEEFQSFSTTMKTMTTESSTLATTACQEQTVMTASDFRIRCNHGYLTDQEHDTFQNSCLIEIYLPNLNIYWEYKQTDKYPTVNSNQAQNQLEVINSLRNHSQLRQNNLSPDPQAIAELLTKLVSHIDTLLEDWYPDLGVKLNQSNEGIYLVERIIPCCACLATPNRYLNNFSRQSLSFSTDNHLQNMMKNFSSSGVNNQFKEMDKNRNGNKYCLNQFSLHNKKLSKSVQFLNHTDNQLKSSYLNSSILSITNDLFTSDSNNNNTITEKYLAHHNMSTSSKWSWPFKWNRYKRAHSADPLKITNDSKNENGNQNKLTDPSTAYTSFVYGISVSEYIHWYVMKKSNKILQPGGLYCPIHSSIQLWAPDLQFKDIPSTLFISTDRVHLLEFLGRGAFGSIFKGSINNSLPIKQQQTGRLSNKIPLKTTNQFNNNHTKEFIREVAVKLCSPIHPNLNSSSSNCNPMFNSVDCERINLSSSKEKCSTSNLSDALFLYRQEQRRWLHNPIEACLTAYQEIRAELNILLPITRNSLYSDQYSFSSSSSLLLLYHKSKHTNRLCNSYSIQEKRSNQSCFNKCLQKNKLKDSNSNDKANNISNNNLLICYGIIYPNPIGFLIPLIPLGNLSDYFTSLLTSYQDLLKTTVNTLEISSVTTNCMNELFINHPLHPITMMLIINQVAKGLAYLHSLSIVHRDVKSENILIWSIPPPSTMMTMMASSSLASNDQNPSKVHIVLTDYGVSRFMSVRDDDEGDNGCRGYVGTPGYMAPEILDYIGEQTYTSKVDIYAMGILLCEMIQLEQPYKKLSSSFYRLAQQVISGVRPDIPQHFIKRCPITLINLMTYCWASDSNRRPSAEQIVHLTNSYQLSTSLLSLSNESIINDCNDDNMKKEKKSNSLSIHYQNNCFSHIQSVHSIDFLKVVTCAVIDNNYNLWLGGYNPIHESFILNNNNDTQSIKLGLLIIIPLDSFSTKSSLLLASWPKIHVLKQYFKSFITQYNLYIKLSDWPIHLCLLNMNVDEEMEKRCKNSDISPQLITCLTYFGELKIYGLNNQHSLKYVCLSKIQLSQCCSTVNRISTSTTNDNNNLFQEINMILSCIKYDYNQHVMNDQDYNSSLSPPLSSSSSATAATTLSNRCIHFILCLSFPKICITKVNIHSSLMLKFDRLIFIDIDQPVHSGIILPEICGSNVWLSQTGGKLVCYAWNDSKCEIHSSSSSSSSSPSLPSSYLKFHSSWFVPSLFNSESSLVTHFLIGSSKLISNRPEPLVEDVDASKHVCVWTYLEPDGKLDCWSAFSQTLLRSINLIQQLDNDMFTENLSTFVGSVNAMEWLNSSSSILLLTTHGYLIHINLMNTNVCGISTTVSLSKTPMTTTNDTTVLRATSTTTTAAAQTSSSSISPSSQSFCQLFHYYGSFSNKDFSLITPLTSSISQKKMTNFPKRIITISKGYLDPLNWINHSFSSSSSSRSFTDSTSFQSDFIKLTMSTNKNHSNMIECLNQEKFYLAKLFSDQFLFP